MLELAQIPVGEFMMGSPESELERQDSESPQHLVSVPSFMMGRYPVTQEQWEIVAGMPKVNHDLNPRPLYFRGSLLPVEQVSWYEAVEFCDRLSAKTKRTYRLPSEAEWEYACRGGTETPFHFGKTINTDVANYRGQDLEFGGKTYPGAYGAGPYGEFRGMTNPVDSFNAPNAFGLCDMHGNVWEWCQDTWHDNYDDAPTDGSAWIDENDNYFRIQRGGSWNVNPRICRCAYRFRDRPGNQNFNDGFRVVCAVPRLL